MNRTFELRAFGFFFLALCLVCGHTAGQKSVPKVVLQVVNRHFTVGKQIPSDYLKVFSDGSVECHAVKSDEHDKDDIRKAQLSKDEFMKVNFGSQQQWIARI